MRCWRPILIGATLLTPACARAPDRLVPVGRLHLAYADSTRTDWAGAGPRPLAVTVWYPAAEGTIETRWSAGVFRFGWSGRAAAFASDARHPLVLLSHGTGGSAGQLSWLAESLAEAGYVAVGVNHHGNTAAEGRQWPHGFVLPWERALDLSAVLDRLLADPDLGSRLDSSRVAAIGFSLGGHTMLALAGARLPLGDWPAGCRDRPTAVECLLPPEASFTISDVLALSRDDAPFRAGIARAVLPTREPRIRAMVLLAPALVPLLDTTSLAGIQVPMRVILGGADTQVPPSPTGEILDRHVATATIDQWPGVGHYDFLAPCSIRGRLVVRSLCGSGDVGRESVHQRTAALVVTFLDGVLGRGEPVGDVPATAPESGRPASHDTEE